MKSGDEKDWTELERRLNIEGLKAFIDKNVIPPLSELEVTPETKDGLPKPLGRALTLALIAFMISFMFISTWLSKNTLGTILSLLLFLPLFIGFMALTIYLMRHQITELIVKAQNNFLVRSQILGRIADLFAMDYVPTPGGASNALHVMSKWKYCPQKIKDVTDMMEAQNGLQVQSEVIRRSGLTMSSDLVLGSEDTKAKHYNIDQENIQFQDGFSGTRNGIDFAVMEWKDSFDDIHYHHLLVHFTLPYKLTGWVEFKNKASQWPKSRPRVSLKDVGIPYSHFAKAYDVRASDQTEARQVFDPLVIESLSLFAANDPVRGVAFDNNLVVDIRGDNRFELVNFGTGQWSEDSIEQTFTDIAQMLEFVDAMANNFTLKARQRS